MRQYAENKYLAPPPQGFRATPITMGTLSELRFWFVSKIQRIFFPFHIIFSCRTMVMVITLLPLQ